MCLKIAKCSLLYQTKSVMLHFGSFIHQTKLSSFEKVAIKMQNRQSSTPGANLAFNGARVSSTNGELIQRFNTDRTSGHGNSSTGYKFEGTSVNS